MSFGHISKKHHPREISCLTILLIEDDPDIRAIATLGIGLDPRMRVVEIDRGSAALEYLRAAPAPSLILLDNTLPDVDGVHLMALIHQEHPAMSGHIAFFTAAVRDQELQRYMAAGAIGVVQKPFDPLTLAERIANLI